MVTFSCMAMSWVGSMARSGADSEEAQQEEEGGGGDAEEVERSPVLQILSQALSFDPLVHLTNNTSVLHLFPLSLLPPLNNLSNAF